MWEEGRVVAPQDREVVQEYKATEGERERETERAYRIRPLGVTVLSRIRPAPLAQTRALTHCNKMVSRRAIYCSRSLGLAFSLSWQHREGPVLH